MESRCGDVDNDVVVVVIVDEDNIESDADVDVDVDFTKGDIAITADGAVDKEDGNLDRDVDEYEVRWISPHDWANK